MLIMPNATITQTWTALMRASRRLLAAVESALKRAGLPPLAWYDILLELERADKGRLRPFELEQRMLLAQYNLSRLIDRLAAAGLVERQPCPDDGRGQIIAPTEAGRALRAKMWPVYAEAIEAHLGQKLTDTDSAQLGRLLDRLAAQH